jgi:ribosomal protein L37E
MPAPIPYKPDPNFDPSSEPLSSDQVTRHDDRWLSTPRARGRKATSPAFRSVKKTMTSYGKKPRLVADVECPECGETLIEPGPRQWCAHCGYGSELPDITLGPEEKVPVWAWIVMAGFAVVAAVALVARLFGSDGEGPGLLIPAMVGAASLGVLGVVLYLIWPSRPQRAPSQPWDGEQPNVIR